MDRANLTELHYIVAIANVESIAQHGILSHKQAAAHPHVDVSMAEIQDLRDKKVVPDVRLTKQRKLHEYANLYLHARNPMMFKRRSQHAHLCVLRVDPAVLDLDGVVISDGNAASDYSRYEAAPGGLRYVDQDMTFARDWRDLDRYAYYEKKRRKCAEVLVPDVVDPRFIVGAYVSCSEGRTACTRASAPWPVTMNPDLFFE